LRLVWLVAAGVLLVPGMARAQSHIGLRAYGIVDLDAVAAKQSFKAVLGTSQLKAFGGGVDVTDLWKHLFVRVAATRARKTSGRVWRSGDRHREGVHRSLGSAGPARARGARRRRRVEGLRRERSRRRYGAHYDRHSHQKIKPLQERQEIRRAF